MIYHDISIWNIGILPHRRSESLLRDLQQNVGSTGGVCPDFEQLGWGGVGWGGDCQRWCSCAHMVRCWYAAGVFMCTHGTLLVRCWCVHVYTWYAAGTQLVCSCVHMVRCWYAAGVFMCTHGTLLVRCWCVHVYTWYAAGTLLVRCWCVHVYTWYAAGTLLVCSCVHMVRCWYAAGVFMCTHGTLLVCHVQRFRCLSFPLLDWVQCISSCHVAQKLRGLFPSLWGLVHQPGRIVIRVLGSKASFAPGHIFSESVCHAFQTRMRGQEVQT